MAKVQAGAKSKVPYEAPDYTYRLDLLDLAGQFLQAFHDLRPQPLFDWPRYFLACHAVELALKAFLASNGCTPRGLKKFGHNIKPLLHEATAKGLQIGVLARGELEHLHEPHAELWPRYPRRSGKPVFKIDQFLSVELQAIDITGSAFPAYQALRAGLDLDKRPTYNFNWDNVYKRYVTQLIRKGYFHHHWRSKIVAVIPEQVYKYIIGRAAFMKTTDVKNDPQVNIIFMTYRLEKDPTRPGEYRPRLMTVEGTSHTNLQNAILYKEPPQRDAFTAQIKSSLVRGAVRLADLIAAGEFPQDLEDHEVEAEPGE